MPAVIEHRKHQRTGVGVQAYGDLAVEVRGDRVPDVRLDQTLQPVRGSRLPVELVQDAGRTQVAPGTVTCCAVGPADSARMDPVTADLTLL